LCAQRRGSGRPQRERRAKRARRDPDAASDFGTDEEADEDAAAEEEEWQAWQEEASDSEEYAARQVRLPAPMGYRDKCVVPEPCRMPRAT
jgi:hypothetical protein